MTPSLSDAARHLNLTHAARRRGTTKESARHACLPGRLPALILMTDARRTPDPVADVLRLPPGAAVIFRHHELVAPARLALARILRAATLARRVTLLIADDMRLALEVGADGVHFSERALRRAGRPQLRKSRWLITAAAHSRPALRRAAQAGATAALLSPVFATASHPGAPALGPLRFAALARQAGLPVYALGGMDARGARRLHGSGAAGIAAIGALTAKALRRPAVESGGRGDFQSFA